MLTKILNFVKTYQSDIITGLTMAIMVVVSFNLGKMSILRNIAYNGLSHDDQSAPLAASPSLIKATANQKGNAPSSKPQRDDSNIPVIASKHSKGKYFHFPWCSAYNRISPQNKIDFPNKAAAITAGYTQAPNCNS